MEGGKIPARMEDTVVALINAAGLNSATAPIHVQGFKPGSLQYMRSIGSKQVQLIDAYDFRLQERPEIYGTDAVHLVYSQPTDWKVAGLTALFDSIAGGAVELINEGAVLVGDEDAPAVVRCPLPLDEGFESGRAETMCR